MSSRFPEPPSASEAEGIPDPGAVTGEQAETGDAEDIGNAMDPPRDTAEAVEDFGTTPEEQRDGEPLDGRLDREQPEVIAQADRPANESQNADTPFSEGSGQGVGRIVEDDQGAREDTQTDMVAEDVGTDLGGYTAEESAMHLEPEA